MQSKKEYNRFMSLIDQHKGILYKIARSYCSDRADEQDLIQEMLLQLWSSFDSYDPNRRWSTWMYRIALNVAISHYRKSQRRREVHRELSETMLQVEPDPIKHDQQRDEIQQLQQFIQELNKMNKALMLLYLDNYRHDEIADILGISKSNVGTKISRIKKQLKKKFESVESNRL